MKNCKYYLNLNGTRVTLNNDKELSDYITLNLVSNKAEFKVKYSLLETQGQTETLEALKGVSEYTSEESTGMKVSTPYSFLREEHPINGKMQLLVPKFEDVNYRKELEEQVTAELKGATKEVIDNEVKLRLKVNSFLETLSKSFGKVFRQRVNFKQGDSIASYETAIKGIVVDVLNFNEQLKNPKAEPIKISDDAVKEYTKTILNIIDAKIKDLKDLNGILKVNQSLSIHNKVLNDAVDMSSAAHLMNIDEAGVPHIYEIKTSEKPFSQWDPVKKRTTDYILGIKRQLLSNFVDTTDTTLNIINIMIPFKDNAFNLDGFSIFSDIERTREKQFSSGTIDTVDALNYVNGPITTRLRELLPASLPMNKQINSELVNKVSTVLNSCFPSYDFKSKLVLQAEPIIKRAIKNCEKQQEVFIYDKLSTHNAKISVSKTDPNWEAEFTKKVEEYLEKWNADKDGRMKALVDEMASMKRSSSKVWNTRFSGTNDVIEKTLYKYIDPEWVMLNISIPELNQLGVLLFHNNKTNTIEAVSITINSLDNIHNLGVGDTILGKFKKNQQTQNKGVLRATGTNIETMKVLAVINELQDILSGQSIANIEVLNLNPVNDKSDYILIDKAVDNFNMLLSTASKATGNNHINNFQNGKLKVADKFLNLYQKITLSPFLNEAAKRTDMSRLSDIVNGFKLGNDNYPKDNNAKLEWFRKLQEAMMNPENGLSKHLERMKTMPDINDPLQFLYDLVSQGVSYYNDLADIFDYSTPKYGISSADATHFVRTAILGSAPEYDKHGHKVVGLMQGNHFATTDALQSVTLTKLHDLVAIAQNKIASSFQREHAPIEKATKEYYDSIGRSDLQRWTVGSANKYHKVFFETENGEITTEFKFKNPWAESSNLDNDQRNYLKNILFILYKNSALNINDVRTIEDLEKSEAFAEIQMGISPIFYAPMIKGSGTERWVPTYKNLHKLANRAWDSVKDGLDIQAQTEEERVRSYNSINMFKKIHNQYDMGNDIEFRTQLLEKYGVDYFEVNLDAIATKYVLEHMREKYLNSVMLDIHAALTVIKFHGMRTGNVKEVTEALDDFWDQIKISVYNTSIIEGEGRDAIALVKKAQRVASLMSIALRPMLMAKELVVGLYKNASFAFYKVYGDTSFGEEDLLFGYTSILDPTQETYILNRALNESYRIANSDLNQIADKKKYDRFGVNFLSDNMYWFSTAPDYINRMSIFLAKMKKDGCYDAHVMNSSGELVYDPSKDKRYEYYLKNRNLYKVNGKYNFAQKDAEFNRQRSLYLAVLDEFNAEQMKMHDKLFTEEDYIPQAYTSKERESIKTFTDTAYGYYDHTRTPLILNKTAGILFGQFLRFYPGKLKYYLGTKNENANRGYMGQKYELTDDGKKVMLWKYEEYEDDGTIIVHEVPESELPAGEIRRPATGWVGEPSEGILYSLAYTAHDLFNHEINQTDPHRIQRAKLALNDLLASIICMWIGSLMIGDKKEWKNKSQGEQDLMKLGMKSMNELNIVTSLFGSLSATPAFVTILGSAATDFKTMLAGDMPVMKVIQKNIRMFELLPQDATRLTK